MASPMTNSLTSFSGADLVCCFANQAIASLQGISWSVQREKAPIFTLGDANARSISRGKRAVAGKLHFAAFDHEALLSAMQHEWENIAPPAMFTAAGNVAIRNCEDFSNILNNIKWNIRTSDAAKNNYENKGFGFTGSSALKPIKQEGSNGAPTQFDTEYNYFVEKWGQGTPVYVPPGFAPLKGESIPYVDTLPPFDSTLTFGNEAGACSFMKIYDIDIMNVSSGASVDTIVMSQEMTYIARKVSPMIKGVYSREVGGMLKGISPTQA